MPRSDRWQFHRHSDTGCTFRSADVPQIFRGYCHCHFDNGSGHWCNDRDFQRGGGDLVASSAVCRTRAAGQHPSRSAGFGRKRCRISQPEWRDLQESGIFQYVSPTWFDENNLTGSSQPARVRLLLVAPNYFALLAVQPQLGRAFDPQDHSPGIIPEVVISDGLWKRSFGADSNILGKCVRMDTDLYRIVGLMPAGFDAPGRTAEERNIEIWAASSFYGA